MTTLSFEEFRAKLADVVTVAINSGKRVGHGGSAPDCCCPLGTVGPFQNPYPSRAAIDWDVDREMAASFIEGFDGDPKGEWGGTHAEAYRLGRLYRERFSR